MRQIGWNRARAGAIAVALAAAFVVTACSDPSINYNYPNTNRPDSDTNGSKQGADTVFGEGGLNLFGGPKKPAGEENNGLAVNAYLWRASLDTIAFMPLASADPFGGVIITDWYTPPETPNERFKMSVYILGRQLRADGVKVSVFRERAAGNGAWVAAKVKPQTATDLENEILTRARQLRMAAINATQ